MAHWANLPVEIKILILKYGIINAVDALNSYHGGDMGLFMLIEGANLDRELLYDLRKFTNTLRKECEAYVSGFKTYGDLQNGIIPPGAEWSRVYKVQVDEHNEYVIGDLSRPNSPFSVDLCADCLKAWNVLEWLDVTDIRLITLLEDYQLMDIRDSRLEELMLM